MNYHDGLSATKTLTQVLLAARYLFRRRSLPVNYFGKKIIIKKKKAAVCRGRRRGTIYENFKHCLHTHTATLRVPVQVSHHEVLKVGGHEAVEGRPVEGPVLGPLRLVVGGHVELRVPQGHTDVVQQPG